MSSSAHDVVRERLLVEYPDVSREYQHVKPLYEAIARSIQELAQRGTSR